MEKDIKSFQENEKKYIYILEDLGDIPLFIL